MSAPSDPVARPPARRRPSVRRTTTITMSWPWGPRGGLQLLGRGRDLLTRPDGSTAVLDQSTIEVVTDGREIRSIAAEPEVPALTRLVGARGGGSLRRSIATEVPEVVARGGPLHLLLDDLAGTTLIAGFALLRWRDELPELGGRLFGHSRPSMIGICAGFRPGSSALSDDGTLKDQPQNVAVVPPLVDPADPLGWHDLHEHPPLAMRRARRIDTWLDHDEVHVDAMFRDSSWEPDGTEIAVHEYAVTARADSPDGRLVGIEAQPRVLPHETCPAAAPNAAWMEGTPLSELRMAVLEKLRGVDCCTHLNDALRALAEVPVLASRPELVPAG